MALRYVLQKPQCELPSFQLLAEAKAPHGAVYFAVLLSLSAARRSRSGGGGAEWMDDSEREREGGGAAVDLGALTVTRSMLLLRRRLSRVGGGRNEQNFPHNTFSVFGKWHTHTESLESIRLMWQSGTLHHSQPQISQTKALERGQRKVAVVTKKRLRT
jgi:hypothetical protein